MNSIINDFEQFENWLLILTPPIKYLYSDSNTFLCKLNLYTVNGPNCIGVLNQNYNIADIDKLSGGFWNGSVFTPYCSKWGEFAANDCGGNRTR